MADNYTESSLCALFRTLGQAYDRYGIVLEICTVAYSQKHLAMLALAMLTLCMSPVRAEEVGPIGGQPLTVLIPLAPTLLDSNQNVKPAILRWLNHVAERAAVRLRTQNANFDRRIVEASRSASTCILGLARRQNREDLFRWIDVIRRDRSVLIARSNDAFSGSLEAAMQIADDQIAVPHGVYRSILNENGIRYVSVDDQRALARMVAAGRVRFGIIVGGAMAEPDVAALPLRVIAELPELEYWFTCNRDMSDELANRLITIFNEPESEELRKLALEPDAQNSTAVVQ